MWTGRARATAVVALLTAGGCADGADGRPPVVVDVVDGDTIDVRIGGRDERVRLLGVDTPEVHVEGGPPECFGPEASQFTAGLLPTGTAVRLERDVVGRDDYGRLLAYVYRVDDGVLVNEALVRYGYARPMTIPPNGTLAGSLVSAAFAAEAAGAGLWTACSGPD